MIYDFLVLNTQGKTPLYVQLYESIKKGILAENLKKGEKLPSIRKMAAGLCLSRTTIENAYQQLCIEGYVENRPQRGYFVAAPPELRRTRQVAAPGLKREKIAYRYNLGSDCIDSASFDTKLWRSYIKDVLNSPQVVSTYGAQQGEEELRQALASYGYSVRGVAAVPEQILVGAGIQPLLYLLCSLLEKSPRRVGFEEPGFNQAEQVFRDYHWQIKYLAADSDGVTMDALENAGVNLLFLNPSAKPMGLSRRYEILKWGQDQGALIIEDDNNGELRYNARPIPAMQGMAGADEVIYIGSFSKLLLPAVRIAYMVLPLSLVESYREKMNYYNQTSSKIEQLALARYIREGQLEKHLRRLRKVYAAKSQLLLTELNKVFDSDIHMTLQETALCLDISLDRGYSPRELAERAARFGVRLMPRADGVRIGFAGVQLEEIPAVVSLLQEAWA